MIIYRRAVQSDLTQVIALLREIMEYHDVTPPDAAGLSAVRRQHLDSQDHLFLVADDDGRLLGMCALLFSMSTWSAAPVCEIQDLIVSRDTGAKTWAGTWWRPRARSHEREAAPGSSYWRSTGICRPTPSTAALGSPKRPAWTSSATCAPSYRRKVGTSKSSSSLPLLGVLRGSLGVSQPDVLSPKSDAPLRRSLGRVSEYRDSLGAARTRARAVPGDAPPARRVSTGRLGLSLPST